MVSNWYIKPVHKSGRGAGGPCFIKDTAAFAQLYTDTVAHPDGIAFLKAAQQKNLALLAGTGKDLGLLEGVYGKPAVAKAKERHLKATKGKKGAKKSATKATKRKTAK
jgi:hypothetical protein